MFCSAQDDFSALVLCILSDVLRPYNCFLKKNFFVAVCLLGFCDDLGLDCQAQPDALVWCAELG